MSIDDRRAQGATRFPFEALVEVGGSLGPSFEAQAIDVSDDGMHLRTAYLPEIGQPLTCRFDAANESVMASGEVVWNQEAGKGGEFGIRFTGLDAESAAAVARITQTNSVMGTRVRLHIDGLGSPMRARVRDSNRAELTVGSELGFLQVGKTLELEDAETGRKRPARIDRVEVEIDPESKVPQLVVALRYDVSSEDVPVEMSEPGVIAKENTPDPTVIDGEDPSAAPDADYESIKSASDQMKGAFSRAAAKAGPAMVDFAKRAKITVALLAARRAAKKEEAAAPPRRMTSPPPGGALHTSGRKVIRGDSLADAKLEADEAAKIGKFPVNKRGIAIGSAAGIALLLCAVAMRKPAAPPVAAVPPPVEQTIPVAAPPSPDPFAPAGATLAG
ncbi:MAG: PilZ domain-containing protein, partial [Polyangiaceae bacterium]